MIRISDCKSIIYIVPSSLFIKKSKKKTKLKSTVTWTSTTDFGNATIVFNCCPGWVFITFVHWYAAWYVVIRDRNQWEMSRPLHFLIIHPSFTMNVTDPPTVIKVFKWMRFLKSLLEYMRSLMQTILHNWPASVEKYWFKNIWKETTNAK